MNRFLKLFGSDKNRMSFSRQEIHWSTLVRIS